MKERESVIASERERESEREGERERERGEKINRERERVGTKKSKHKPRTSIELILAVDTQSRVPSLHSPPISLPYVHLALRTFTRTTVSLSAVGR